MLYRSFVRPLLFNLEPETAHYAATGALAYGHALLGGALRARFDYRHPSLERKVFGLTFKNPLGLAAGFDKDALWVDALADLGFGFVEIGTLTPKPQPGNPKPRLFRLPQDQALVNRLGFNNGGAEAAARRLERRKSAIVVGGNIGKNKTTPNQEAVNDYLSCFRTLFDVVDYFTVNVSSPNTPNLRDLQEKEPLRRLLSALQEVNHGKPKPKPILLKIAPDLTEGQLDDIVELAAEVRLSGLVATNTTVSRDGLKTPADTVERIGNGGLSGPPVKALSAKALRYLSENLDGDCPLVGVGGIRTARDAREKLEAGATLLQAYTGFVYEGAAFASNICKGLLNS